MGRCSEVEFEIQLKDSWVEGTRDRTEGWRSEAAVRLAEGGRVRDIDCLGAEFGAKAVRQGERLADPVPVALLALGSGSYPER